MNLVGTNAGALSADEQETLELLEVVSFLVGRGEGEKEFESVQQLIAYAKSVGWSSER